MTWYRGLEGLVRERVPLAPRTSYRVGGPAEFFCEPPDEAALAAALRQAYEARLATRVLGHGSNLLVSDSGVAGLVVRLPRAHFVSLSRDDTRLDVGAGQTLQALVHWAAARGLSGLEGLIGVPGTLGAALRMNAGGRYGEVGAHVTAVAGFERDGTPFQFDHETCGFAYRGSALGERIITRCEMALEESEPAATQARMRAVFAEKLASQPLAVRSAGCVFKNPNLPGVPPAGKLIEDLGLKGARSGGAHVSAKHANFLVCEEGAQAADVAALIRLIRRRALRERGVQLELEIIAWGFPPGALESAA